MKILIALIAAGVASTAAVALVVSTSSQDDMAGVGPNQQVLVGMPVINDGDKPHCSSCVTEEAKPSKAIAPAVVVADEPQYTEMELKIVADLKAAAAGEGDVMDCCPNGEHQSHEPQVTPTVASSGEADPESVTP